MSLFICKITETTGSIAIMECDSVKFIKDHIDGAPVVFCGAVPVWTGQVYVYTPHGAIIQSFDLGEHTQKTSAAYEHYHKRMRASYGVAKP